MGGKACKARLTPPSFLDNPKTQPCRSKPMAQILAAGHWPPHKAPPTAPQPASKTTHHCISATPRSNASKRFTAPGVEQNQVPFSPQPRTTATFAAKNQMRPSNRHGSDATPSRNVRSKTQ